MNQIKVETIEIKLHHDMTIKIYFEELVNHKHNQLITESVDYVNDIAN